MKEKNTKELNEVLGKTHLSDFEKYCAENKESVSDNSEAFSIYVKNLLQERSLPSSMCSCRQIFRSGMAISCCPGRSVRGREM